MASLTLAQRLEVADYRPWALLAPALITLALLMVVPMAIIFVFSFHEFIDVARDRPAFQFANWREFFEDQFYHYAIWQTLRIAGITTLVCIALGYIPAYYIATTTFRHKWLLMLLLILPFWVSFIIRQLSWVHVLGSQGIINAVLLWLGVPAFWLIDTASVFLILIALAVYQIVFSMMYGPQGALFSEMFGTRVRYSGASIGYQIGGMLGGALAPIIATALFAATGSSISIAAYMAVVCAISLVSVLLITETYQTDL
jgi:ABC-type sugar transport system permease subunit